MNRDDVPTLADEVLTPDPKPRWICPLLAARVLVQEHIVYPKALGMVASGKARLL